MHDSAGCIGVAQAPRRCGVDPQKPENTIEKPVGRGKRGLAAGSRGGQEGGRAPLFPPSGLKSAPPGARSLRWCWPPAWGVVGDARVVGFLLLLLLSLFFHLKPFSFQHAEAENTSPAESRHLGKSLYARSSGLMLSLVSEIVLLWLQVTPQIAT